MVPSHRHSARGVHSNHQSREIRQRQETDVQQHPQMAKSAQRRDARHNCRFKEILWHKITNTKKMLPISKEM